MITSTHILFYPLAMKLYAWIAIVLVGIVIDETTPAIPLFTELKGTLQRVLDHADRIHNQKKMRTMDRSLGGEEDDTINRMEQMVKELKATEHAMKLRNTLNDILHPANEKKSTYLT